MNMEEYSRFETIHKEIADQVNRQGLIIDRVCSYQLLSVNERDVLKDSYNKICNLVTQLETELITVSDEERRAQLKRARDALEK